MSGTRRSVLATILAAMVVWMMIPVTPAVSDSNEPTVYTFFGEDRDGGLVTFEWQPDGKEDHLTNCFAWAPSEPTCSNDGHDGLPAMHGFFVVLGMFDGLITSTITDGENVRTLGCYLEGYQPPQCFSEGTWPERVPWEQHCLTLGSGFWVCSSNHLDPED